MSTCGIGIIALGGMLALMWVTSHMEVVYRKRMLAAFVISMTVMLAIMYTPWFRMLTQDMQLVVSALVGFAASVLMLLAGGAARM